jgi:hypothetical protein
MRKEIADEWVAALPHYQQGKKQLCTGELYCCLGVLCELAIKHGVTKKHGMTQYGKGLVWRDNYLPSEVQEWAGMNSSDGTLMGEKALADLNDEGMPFEEIAKVIEKNWMRL